MKTYFKSLTVLAIVGLFALSGNKSFAGPIFPHQQGTTNGEPQPSAFRLVSSASGSKETRKNQRYIIEDPRTVFYVPGDHQVIMVFEWQGTPGLHRFKGNWVDPTGKIVSVQSFDIQSLSDQYSCSWTLNIPDNVMQGLWALEVQIDGHPASERTFEIKANPNGPKQPAPPPSAADVYSRAVAASAFIESLDSNGNVIRQGSGFFIGDESLVTAFQVIDGATSLRIEFPDGHDVPTNQVVAWNRRQDWAILKIAAPRAGVLQQAPANSWKVGDVGYLLGSPNENSRTIQNVGITGIEDSPDAGERVNTSWYGSPRTIGSPLLDSYGRVIGVLGGTLIPGVETLRRTTADGFTIVGEEPNNAFVSLVVPLSMIPAVAGSRQPVTLSDLAAQNLFVKPLPRDLQVMSGTLCKDFKRSSYYYITPVDPTTTFSREGNILAAVITWNPDKKIKTTLQFRIFDLNNGLKEESRPSKFELHSQATGYTGVKLPVASLKPGLYRVDLLLGNEPEWRAFFRVTP